MTPAWLEAHASYIDSSHLKSAGKLKFNAGSVERTALLKVPMIPAGALKSSTSLTIEITLVYGIDSMGQGSNRNVIFGLSDGTKFIGFDILDIKGHCCCSVVEGTSGSSLTATRFINSVLHTVGHAYALLIDEYWPGRCYTTHDIGFIKTAGYNNRLILRQGITLEVYKGLRRGKIAIKYINVTITQGGLS